MYEELTSAKHYQQPSADEILADQKTIAGPRKSIVVGKAIFVVVLSLTLLGGGTYMFFNAVANANRRHSWSGHGSHPAMSMLSFCMGLLDPKWDDRVEERIRSNRRPPMPRHQVPEIDEPDYHDWQP